MLYSPTLSRCCAEELGITSAKIVSMANTSANAPVPRPALRGRRVRYARDGLIVTRVPPLSQPAGISRRRRFEATTRLSPKTETTAQTTMTRMSHFPRAMALTPAAAHTVSATPASVDRNRSEMRRPISADDRVTRPTQPTIRIERFPVTRAAIDPRPRVQCSAVTQLERYRRRDGSGWSLLFSYLYI